MTTLRFALPLRSSELQNIDVPVEVRDLKMRLIGETTATGTLTVPQGKRYVVTARLPAGQVISEFIDAGESDLTVTLSLPQEEETLHDWEEGPTYFASQRAQRSSAPPLLRKITARLEGLETLGLESMRGAGLEAMPEPLEAAAPPELPQATVHFFTGNVLAGNAQPVDIQVERRSSSEAMAELVIPPAGESRWLHCRYSDGSTVNLALPVSGASGCTIVIRREATRYWIEAYPRNQNASLLLGYAQNRLGDEESKLAERLLYEKFGDPLAAAVGAYSLLRVSSLTRMHDWTANLMLSFPTLPDGAAVRGEHLARLGRHEEAFEAFVAVTQRGLPIFSDGVRFTYDRLRYYADESSGIPSMQDRLREARQRLKKFVNAIDFTKTVTTFAGMDPNQPKSTPGGPPLPGGMEVAQLFAG